MIEVMIFPTRDCAEVETPEDAVFAARTMMADARTKGVGHQTATFLVDGKAVRCEVKEADL